MKWKKKQKIYRLKRFIEVISLVIKQCYDIVWCIEKIQIKTQKLYGQKMEE